MWMKSMTLHQQQQVSNVKEEEDWSENKTLWYSKYHCEVANDTDRDAAVRTYCVCPVR